MLGFLILSLPLALGCRKDSPAAPKPILTDITLATIWPNDDGRSWTYEQKSRRWEDPHAGDVYATAAEVPAAPTLTEAAALLGTQPIGGNVVESPASYRLRFEGMASTQSGALGQNLTELLIRPGAERSLIAGGGGDARLLSRLMCARPDLRRAALARLGATADTVEMYGALLLHGYVWRKTADWIATFGDLDTLPSWKYLTSNLTAGTEFHHQLVPMLADDVWLHGRILGRANVSTPAGSWSDAVVCLYVIDYGVAAGTDLEGNVLGYSRFYEYGTVAYVDAVGPVACYDRQLVNVAPGSVGYGDVTLRLTATTPALWSVAQR